MSIDSLGLHLGPFYLRFYGIILITGAILGAYVASLEAKRKGLNPDTVWDALIWALIGGVIGARIYHIFTPPSSMVAAGITTQYYLDLRNTSPLNVDLSLINVKFTLPVPSLMAVWMGGLGIPGGIVGGLIGVVIFAVRNKLSPTLLIDLAAPATALAQAIGRWGNFVNQELYGRPTDLPWGIFISPEYRLPGYTDVERFHPTFLYESILNFGVFLALMWVSRRYAASLKGGDLFILYLVLYPTVRFFMEFLRLDSSNFGNLNLNQSLSAATALIFAVTLFIRHRRQRRVRTISGV
jgi:phosphatidylglycerol:prolipoprotein diacylglycerol transferase